MFLSFLNPLIIFLETNDPEVRDHFSNSTQVSKKFILLINVKRPTIGVLKLERYLAFGILVLYAAEISSSVELSMKKFYKLGANCLVIVLLCACVRMYFVCLPILCLFLFDWSVFAYVLGYGSFISDTYYYVIQY